MNVGIPVRIDAQHAIAHNKIMVIDGATVITGSFNFTKNAEANNAENLLVIRSPELAAKYAANWKVHADHSEPYGGRTEGYSQTHRAGEARRSAASSCSDLRWLCRLQELRGVPQGGLQVGGKDFGEEPGAVRHAGRGDPGGKEAVPRVQSVSPNRYMERTEPKSSRLRDAI